MEEIDKAIAEVIRTARRTVLDELANSPKPEEAELEALIREEAENVLLSRLERALVR